MPKKDPAKLTSVKIKIPWLGEAEWKADATERRAAWSLYVELVTRVAVESLSTDDRVRSVALSSLHSLFDSTRQILREAGPTGVYCTVSVTLVELWAPVTTSVAVTTTV
jgi:hypothetical protein